MIRAATEEDAAAICAIYNPFVTGSVITFEETPVAESDMRERIATLSKTHPWYVAVRDGAIAGYAYAGPWRPRAAYRVSAESTVYVGVEHARRGIGSELYDVLLADLPRRGIHSVLGGIALPNPASVALHESKGFVKVAHLREVGWKLGRRVDVGYWQRMLPT